MSNEEYVNAEAMELTEEIVPAEEIAPVEEIVPAEEIAPVEEIVPVEEIAPVEEIVPVEEISLIDEDLVDNTLIEEDLAEAFEIEDLAAETLETPEMDEELFEIAEEDFGFEIEEEETEAAPEVAPVDPLQAKCNEIRNACRDTISRIAYDLKETNYNPYIRSTTTYRYEIMKKSTDEQPVDVFEFQRTSGFSIRAMAITTALVAAADLATRKILKKKLKK